MSVKLIFVGLFGLAVILALPAIALASPQADIAEGMDAFESQDHRKAARLFRKAAEQGHFVAQFLLGAMYQEGFGVTQNDGEAVRWWRKAAEQGYADAQFNLGNMYRAGRGVARDNRGAVRWYRQAAEQGHALAQFYLGAMYQEGKGVAQNYVQAHKWFNISSALGHKEAKRLHQEVETKMSAQQIGQAQTEATKWLEAHKKRRP